MSTITCSLLVVSGGSLVVAVGCVTCPIWATVSVVALAASNAIAIRIRGRGMTRHLRAKSLIVLSDGRKRRTTDLTTVSGYLSFSFSFFIGSFLVGCLLLVLGEII